MTDRLEEIAKRHEERAAAARAKAEHRKRMAEDRAYREAEKMANGLERYALNMTGPADRNEALYEECRALATKIRAMVAKP